MAFVPWRWQWVPLVAAVVVGVALVYFGGHNPLDIVAGAGFGSALAALSRAFIFEPGEAPLLRSS